MPKEYATIFCTYDADTLMNPADGRKLKGVITGWHSTCALPIEIRLYDRLFSVPNQAPRRTSVCYQPRIISD